MDLGDDFSNLYSEEYINRIRQEKMNLGIIDEALTEKLDRMKETYIQYNLHILNFLPYKFDSYDKFIKALEYLAGYSAELCTDSTLLRWKNEYSNIPETQKFLQEFIEIMEHEKEIFYKSYWENKQKGLMDIKNRFMNFCIENGTKILLPVIRHEKKEPLIYLSLSMTCNGRGCSSTEFLKAGVKFPERREDFLNSFFTSIHEMTHQFIDNITFKSLGVNDRFNGIDYNTHLIREYAVIYMDYLLCKSYIPEYLGQYMGFMLDLPLNNAEI
jgi:hypothetical protein